MAHSTKSLDLFFRSHLDIEGFASNDDSLNGLQIDNDGAGIKKIAFAVDANMEVFQKAREAGADMIFAHHGMFWGKPVVVEKALRDRLKFLLDNNIALYAAHLPLDAHPTLGNNAALAELLGITNPEPFANYHGKYIGFKGLLAEPLSVSEAAERISFMGRPVYGVMPFGKEKNLTAAVCSGGAAYEAMEAIADGVDLYVSGEYNHHNHHWAKESGLNIIAGGHYMTEVWGVLRVMELVKKELGVEGVFIDAPTGL